MNQILLKKILSFLRENPGSNSYKISSELEIDKNKVNNILYKQLKDECKQDSSYNWYLKKDFKVTKSDSTNVQVNTPLTKICKYYASCIAKDKGARVKVLAQSKYYLDYQELESLPTSSDEINDFFESSKTLEFLRLAHKDKSKHIYFGYPIVLYKMRSSKSNFDEYFVSPVFLFPIKIQDNDIKMDLNYPTINRDVLERYADAEGEELMKELVTLEEDLGISREGERTELDELAQRLRNLRPEWQWIEEIDPYNLNKKPPIQECITEGVLNRAVVVKVQEKENNFTRGLEYELNKLSQLSESDYKDTALGQWVHRKINTSNKKNLDSLLEVFPMNLEQRESVKSALINDLTVITGPPGTGKSQVVANLLINAAWKKKRVLFASKNNKAVDVVESRVNNIGKKPITFLLRLSGERSHQQLALYLSNLLSTTVNQQDEQDFVMQKQEFEDLNNELLIIDSQVNDFVSLRNSVDKLDRDIEYVRSDLTEDMFDLIKSKNFSFIQHKIELLLHKLESALDTKKSFFVKVSDLIFGSKKNKIIFSNTQQLEDTIIRLNIEIPSVVLSSATVQVWNLFKNQLQNRCNQINRVSKYFETLDELKKNKPLEVLTKQRLNLLKRMSHKSSNLWRLWLKLQVLRLSAGDRSLLNQYRSTLQMASRPNPTKSVWRNYYKQSQQISHILPTWAVTSLSAKGRIPLNKDVFDLVVFDEASQCDIASALPLLYRAKQAVVIGDPKQLSHISSISKKQDERLLEKYDLLDTHSDFAYSYNSLFDLAAGLSPSASIINLRDHYRSHADIISFSNQFFYEGRLRIATHYDSLRRPKNDSVGVRWINVNGRSKKPPSGTGSQNEEEAEALVMELRKLFEQRYEGTIGVASPFRAQANLIRRLVGNDKELSTWVSKREFISETVHKFQGDERDIILFSPVISNGISKGSILFLKKTGNLFNVAITRARAMLFVIGNRNAVLHSGISYMEKFAQYVREVRKQNERKVIHENELGPDYPTVRNPERVSEWEHIFYKALHSAGVSTIPQYQEEMYTLDFAIFDGDRKLNIEIDGEQYHKDWTGELCYRDQIRNQRMFELGWDVKRFWVYEIKDNLEESVETIKKWIDSK